VKKINEERRLGEGRRRPEAPPIPRYREFRPPLDLAAHAACTWEHSSRALPLAPLQPVIPDGCADIIVFGDDPPHVAAPSAVTEFVRPPPAGTLITAIRFRPGAVRSILRCDADKLGPWGVELAEICGRHTQTLTADLVAADSAVSRRAALENWTRQRIAAASDADRLVLTAGAMLTREPWTTVDELAGLLDVSGRQLRRRFIAACGYGPKTLQRIMRLQRTLRLVSPPVRFGSLADLAVAAGYADQAHMTREFQSIVGFTPACYMPLHDPELSRWIDA
jgi:AraC-like DNA-binding protein